MILRILQGDVRERLRELPDESVHCVVTSPPYWGLRDYGVDGQLGLERSLGEHTDVMVDVFREVRRVLRRDGTLWLNYGDSYATSPNGRSAADTKALGDDDRTFRDKPFSTIGPIYADDAKRASMRRGRTGNLGNGGGGRNGVAIPDGRIVAGGVLKPKDLCGVPWRLAFALQDDGWWLRQDNVWYKPNAMPSSVKDRCATAHEYLFQLAKSERYFFDYVAIREPGVCSAGTRGAKGSAERKAQKGVNARPPEYKVYDGWRNRRSVWTVATTPCKEAHYATFPPKLIGPCIQAGTSERGCCPHCGAPWRRIVEKRFVPQGDVSPERGVRGADGQKPMDASNSWEGYPRGSTQLVTVGWKPTCKCPEHEPVPAVVLDPFLGSGTTALVARELGRSCIGIELNPKDIAIIERRLGARSVLEVEDLLA